MGLLGDRSAPLRRAQAECDDGSALARMVGMPDAVVTALGDSFERWDGKGHAAGRLGDGVFRVGFSITICGRGMTDAG